MRVLITRPEFQAERTAEKIAALGHEPVSFPLAQPEHDLARAIEALRSPHAAIILTSAEAARCLERLGPLLDPYLGSTVFAIGRATGRAASALGFADIVVATGGGQDLGELIAERRPASAGPLLYLAGARRHGRLETVLTERGIACIIAEIYDMRPIAYPIEEQQRLLVSHPVDAVFFYSREAARAFFALDVFRTSRDALTKTLFFCLSRNIAEAVPEELKNSAVVSMNPDEEELIDLL